jgi:hypothetical protein
MIHARRKTEQLTVCDYLLAPVYFIQYYYRSRIKDKSLQT